MQICLTFDAFTVTAEGQDVKECLAQLGEAMEIFKFDTCRYKDDSGTECGGKAAPFHRRSQQGYDFYGMRCECGAEFRFGTRSADGKLFPRRKDKAGDWLPDMGWSKFTPQQRADQESMQDQGEF